MIYKLRELNLDEKSLNKECVCANVCAL